jgi:hypothetical protein
MLCAAVDLNNFIIQAAPLSDGTCANWVLLSKIEFGVVSTTQIVADDILLDFTWGFGAVLFFWSLGYAVGAAKKAIQLL